VLGPFTCSPRQGIKREDHQEDTPKRPPENLCCCPLVHNVINAGAEQSFNVIHLQWLREEDGISPTWVVLSMAMSLR